MTSIAYRDGSYSCAACHETLQIPAGANVRQSFTTVHDGTRDRVLIMNGHATHRCTDNETTGLGRPSALKRRR